MTDDGRSDLSLLVDMERSPGARPRHRRQRRGRRFLGSVIALVVVAALIAGVFYGGRAIMNVFGDVPDYTGSGGAAVQVRIDQGDTAADIATALLDAGVIQSERAFREAATADPDSLSIQPGLYQLRAELPAAAALDLLLDPQARLSEIVTIPEGFIVEQVLLALSESTGLSLAELQSAAQQSEAIGLPAYAGGKLEGFLYPSTYELDPDDSAVEVLQTLTAQFTAMADRLQLEERAAALGVTPYEIVTIASMIQSESRIDAERPMIARVVYNRLAQDIPLGIDATSAYELRKPGSELTTEELQNPTPFNTRVNLGLTPTPISNPGEASLEAALEPTPGDWIYYVLEDADGNHFFTASAAEFEAAKAQCVAKGLGCG